VVCGDGAQANLLNHHGCKLQMSSVPTSRTDRSGDHTWFFFLLTSLLVSSQNTLALVGLPLLAEDRGYTSTELGILLAAFPLAQALTSLTAGPFSDWVNRRNLILAGQAVFATSLILHPWASNFGVLVGLRLTAGVGAGVLVSLPLPYLTDHYEKSDHQPVISRSASGHALGYALGVPFGILFLESVTFIQLAGACGLLAVLLLTFKIFRLPVASLSLPRPPTTSRKEARNAAPHVANFRRILALSALGFCGTSLFYVTANFWFVHGLGHSPREIAGIYLVAGLLQFFVLVVIVPRFGAFNPWCMTAISFGGNSLMLILWTVFLPYSTATFGLFGLAAGTLALRIAPIQYLITHSGSSKTKGLRNSLNQGCQSGGRAIGNFVGTSLISTPSIVWLGYGAALLLIASLTLIGQRRSTLPESSEFGHKRGIGTHSAKLKMSSKQSS